MENFIQWDPDVKRAFTTWREEKAAREKERQLKALAPPPSPKRSFEEEWDEEMREFRLEAQDAKIKETINCTRILRH